jgi:hypothetical protein
MIDLKSIRAPCCIRLSVPLVKHSGFPAPRRHLEFLRNSSSWTGKSHVVTRFLQKENRVHDAYKQASLDVMCTIWKDPAMRFYRNPSAWRARIFP